MFELYNVGFPALWSLTFWFRKLREVCGKNSHQVAPLKTIMITSYDPPQKKFTSTEFTSINVWAYQDHQDHTVLARGVRLSQWSD